MSNLTATLFAQNLLRQRQDLEQKKAEEQQQLGQIFDTADQASRFNEDRQKASYDIASKKATLAQKLGKPAPSYESPDLQEAGELGTQVGAVQEKELGEKRAFEFAKDQEKYGAAHGLQQLKELERNQRDQKHRALMLQLEQMREAAMLARQRLANRPHEARLAREADPRTIAAKGFWGLARAYAAAQGTASQSIFDPRTGAGGMLQGLSQKYTNFAIQAGRDPNFDIDRALTEMQKDMQQAPPPAPGGGPVGPAGPVAPDEPSPQDMEDIRRGR